MGIYIKGMEIPKNCITCLFQTPYMGGWCFLLDGNSNAYSRRHDCPLVPVPKHGDLIDRMALLESIKEARKKDPDVEDVYIDDYFIVAEWLMFAPTVIEAEEAE